VFWQVTLGVTGTICFAKQFINVVQIVNASKTLAAIDQEDRAKEALQKSS
jgi:CDP-diacylglycerol--inositol 3-phosphatidyltransferase